MPHCADYQAFLHHTKLKAYAKSQSQMPMQGWTVFHLVSLIGHDDFGWSKFRGSLFESLLYCHAKLSYSDAEVGGCVAHDVSHHDVFYLEQCRVACTLFAAPGSETFVINTIYMFSLHNCSDVCRSPGLSGCVSHKFYTYSYTCHSYQFGRLLNQLILSGL